MKGIVFFICMTIGFTTYAQQDTIVTYEKDITRVYETGDRGGKFFYYVVKENPDKPLKGFYKIIMDEDTFYTCFFDSGMKHLYDPSDYNIVKYYRKEGEGYKLYQLDVYEPPYIRIRSHFLIENFSCKAKKLKVYHIDTSSDEVLEKYNLKLRISEKAIVLMRRGKNILFFPKEGLCE